MRLSSIVLFLSALLAASLAAPAVEKVEESNAVEQVVDAEPTTVASVSDSDDEVVEVADSTVLPEEEATTLPSTRDGRQIPDDEDEDADDDAEDDDDDDEDEEDEEEEEDEAARNQVVKSAAAKKNKSKSKTAESKPVPVLGEGGVEDDEAEDLGIFEREEAKSDEKASDEKESDEDQKDEQEDEEEEESAEDEERDEPSGRPSRRPQPPAHRRNPKPDINGVVPVNGGEPPVLSDVDQQKLGDPPSDYPIITDALRKTMAQLAPQKGSPSVYKLTSPKRPKTKNAGLINVNGKKKVYVEFDDGSVKIIEDVSPAKIASAGAATRTNKTHSVFHEIADFVFDLVGNREDFLIGDDDDHERDAEGGGEDADDEEDGDEDEDVDDTRERAEGVRESEEIMAPDRDAYELGLHLDELTRSGNERIRIGELMDDPDDTDYRPFREELTYE